jgi:hypothetical protein
LASYVSNDRTSFGAEHLIINLAKHPIAIAIDVPGTKNHLAYKSPLWIGPLWIGPLWIGPLWPSL